MIVLCDSCYADIESHICWFMRRGNIVTAPNAVVLLSISNARHPITVVSMSSSSSIWTMLPRNDGTLCWVVIYHTSTTLVVLCCFHHRKFSNSISCLTWHVMMELILSVPSLHGWSYVILANISRCSKLYFRHSMNPGSICLYMLFCDLYLKLKLFILYNLVVLHLTF